jgi:hypothetical protein
LLAKRATVLWTVEKIDVETGCGVMLLALASEPASAAFCNEEPALSVSFSPPTEAPRPAKLPCTARIFAEHGGDIAPLALPRRNRHVQEAEM